MATSDLANELAKESFRFDNTMAEKQASGRAGGCACKERVAALLRFAGMPARLRHAAALQGTSVQVSVQPAAHARACRCPSRTPAPFVQVSDVVLNQLEDASGDISGLAVKW